jgi:hypothetical protein
MAKANTNIPAYHQTKGMKKYKIEQSNTIYEMHPLD